MTKEGRKAYAIEEHTVPSRVTAQIGAKPLQSLNCDGVTP
jgi:hypothetical protein